MDVRTDQTDLASRSDADHDDRETALSERAESADRWERRCDLRNEFTRAP